MPAERFGAARLLCRLPVPRHESGLFHRTLLRSAPEKAAMSEPRLALKNSGASQRIVKARRANEPDDIEMAILYPRDTGLPMTVWVSPRGRARHDARVKVCLTPGDRMDSTNTAVVAIRPVPRVVSGTLPRREFALVSQWITENRAALIAYRDGKLSTVEFAIQMRPLPGAAR